MLGFSVFLVRSYEDRADRELPSTIVATAGLTLVLAAVSLVPVDIFLLSSTINPTTGLPQAWATPDVIAQQENIVTTLYYGAGHPAPR
jgi:LMBR1 domain-containing protein 1